MYIPKYLLLADELTAIYIEYKFDSSYKQILWKEQN